MVNSARIRRTRKQPKSSPKTETKILRAAIFNSLPWLRHGFSTRLTGSSQACGRNQLNLGFTEEDDRSRVEKNRAAFAQEISGDAWPLITLKQIHSSSIFEISSSAIAAAKKDSETAQCSGDGLLTQRPEILLAIKTADCFPILLVSRKPRAVAALHAGWRGTLARIAEKGVGEMRRAFGAKPEDIFVAIGPGIHACCYAVGEEVRGQFISQFTYAAELFGEAQEEDDAQRDSPRRKYPLMFMDQRAPGHGAPAPEFHLDLVEADRRQLIAAGVPPANIEVLPYCTSCRTDLFFSHRAERGKTGRMMSAIGISTK